MERPRLVPGTDAEGILLELTTRQHLAPHRSVGQVVGEVVKDVGVCPAAADRALERLGLESGRSIGRLRRAELSQLARAMHRYWTQSLAVHPEESTAAPSSPGQ